MKEITLSKDCFQLLKEVIGKRNCKFCKIELTGDNFGYLSVDLSSCREIICLNELAEELELEK